MKKIILVAVVCAALAGCSSISVVEKGSSDITIEYVPGNYEEVKAEAGKHCGRYGKTAIPTGTSCPSDNRCLSNFNCVR